MKKEKPVSVPTGVLVSALNDGFLYINLIKVENEPLQGEERPKWDTELPPVDLQSARFQIPYVWPNVPDQPIRSFNEVYEAFSETLLGLNQGEHAWDVSFAVNQAPPAIRVMLAATTGNEAVKAIKRATKVPFEAMQDAMFGHWARSAWRVIGRRRRQKA